MANCFGNCVLWFGFASLGLTRSVVFDLVFTLLVPCNCVCCVLMQYGNFGWVLFGSFDLLTCLVTEVCLDLGFAVFPLLVIGGLVFWCLFLVSFLGLVPA